ncbi:MAG TPA: PLP-dependent aminotransferase family protein [Kiloniellales bacterium]|nr:PLP-dependent aminotransferase family protein [Kiloniellales bacterium]
MLRRASTASLFTLTLERDATAPPLYRQVYDQVRLAVLEGRLPPGARLPSSRVLAAELRCSRNTVVGAFEQLLAEGYLEGHVGSGTYVSRVLPDELLSARPIATQRPAEEAAGPGLGRRGQRLAQLDPPGLPARRADAPRAFVPGMPETAFFPFPVWGRLVGRFWRVPPRELLRPGEPGGFRPLREAIAAYLRAVRALPVEPEQIFVTSGAQQALDLVARLLLDPGDEVWIEDPGYAGLRGPLLAAGAEIVPLSVDAEGIDVSEGVRKAPQARMAAVTPARQYPLGLPMSLARRLELLAWAQATEAWVVEDDYDSEYRYAGRPLAPLQSLDEGAGRVVYVGSLSKVLFPSIRLGYLVVPPSLVQPVTRARAVLEDYPALALQPALAAFIQEGHFAAHLRRMRALYQARQDALLEAAKRHLSGLLDLSGSEAGLHLLGRLKIEGLSDHAASKAAAAAGLLVSPLSAYYYQDPPLGGTNAILLGFSAVPEEVMDRQVQKLAQALERAPQGVV